MIHNYLHILIVQVPHRNIVTIRSWNVLLNHATSCEEAVTNISLVLVPKKRWEIIFPPYSLTMNEVPRQCSIRICWFLKPLSKAFFTCNVIASECYWGSMMTCYVQNGTNRYHPPLWVEEKTAKAAITKLNTFYSICLNGSAPYTDQNILKLTWKRRMKILKFHSCNSKNEM